MALLRALVLLSALLFAVVLAEVAEVEVVATRSFDKRFPDALELEVRYADGETERLHVKRNYNYNSNVAVESIQNNVVKRHLSDNTEKAEYISERAAVHVTSEHDGERYRRSISGLVYRRNVAYAVQSADMREKRDLFKSVFEQIVKRTDGSNVEMEGVPYNDDLMPPPFNRSSFSRTQYPVGTNLIVDVMAVIDYSLYQTMRTNFESEGRSGDVIRYVRDFYGAIFAGIVQRYHAVNHRGMRTTPRLAQILIATSAAEDHWTYAIKDRDELKANDGLDNVAKWMENQKAEGRYLNVDHTMLFTGLKMWSWANEGTPQQSKSFAVVGLAYTGAICSSLSASIIEERLDLISIGTSAHELGHSLGARHDGPPLKSQCPDSDHHLMCPYVTSGNDRTFRNQYSFSTCSMDSMVEVMERLNRFKENCMTDNPAQAPEVVPLASTIPGIRLDLHAQCKAYLKDANSYYCGPNTADYMRNNACHKFECFQYGRCQDVYNHHALHGTPCGGDRWCQNGECVPAPDDWRDYLNQRNGRCPVRDYDHCYASSNVCSDRSKANTCCNKCLS